MPGVGIITSIHFRMRGMSTFDLIMIFTLLFGWIGLFLSSLRTYSLSSRSRGKIGIKVVGFVAGIAGTYSWAPISMVSS